MTNSGKEYSDVDAVAPWARESLIDFAITTDPSYDPNWHHELIAEKLEAVERGEIKRLMIFAPPRSGKTELTSIKFPAWYKGKHPERHIIQTSYSTELAQDFGQKTRDLVNDSYYQKIFPGVVMKDDSQARGLWRTFHKSHPKVIGSYLATGIGGPVTGFGANLLLLDDPIKNREEADSETMRNKVWDWYTSTARTRLEKDAVIAIINTRWHPDDLCGRLLERQGEEWEILSLPAIAEKDEKYRKAGEALWPQKYDLEAMRAIEREIGPKDWLALYMGRPTSQQTQEFKEEWFRYFAPDDHLTGRVYISVDPAISEQDTACNSAVVPVCREPDSANWYVMPPQIRRMDPLQLVDCIFEQVKLYDNKERSQRPIVGIETVAYQKSLLYYVQQKMKDEEYYFDVVELRTTAKKEIRIRGLIPLYKTGVIFHARSEGSRQLEKEAIDFPSGKLVDGLDALAHQLTLQDGAEGIEVKEREPGSDRMEKVMKQRIKRARYRAVI